MVKKSPEPKIAEAVGVVFRSKVPGLGPLLEKAMSDAVLKCLDEGITDPDVQRERMRLAREDAKAAHTQAIHNEAKSRQEG